MRFRNALRTGRIAFALVLLSMAALALPVHADSAATTFSIATDPANPTSGISTTIKLTVQNPSGQSPSKVPWVVVEHTAASTGGHNHSGSGSHKFMQDFTPVDPAWAGKTTQEFTTQITFPAEGDWTATVMYGQVGQPFPIAVGAGPAGGATEQTQSRADQQTGTSGSMAGMDMSGSMEGMDMSGSTDGTASKGTASSAPIGDYSIALASSTGIEPGQQATLTFNLENKDTSKLAGIQSIDVTLVSVPEAAPATGHGHGAAGPDNGTQPEAAVLTATPDGHPGSFAASIVFPKAGQYLAVTRLNGEAQVATFPIQVGDTTTDAAGMSGMEGMAGMDSTGMGHPNTAFLAAIMGLVVVTALVVLAQSTAKPAAAREGKEA